MGDDSFFSIPKSSGVKWSAFRKKLPLFLSLKLEWSAIFLAKEWKGGNACDRFVKSRRKYISKEKLQKCRTVVAVFMKLAGKGQANNENSFHYSNIMVYKIVTSNQNKTCNPLI